MITKIQGRWYNFEIGVQNEGTDFCFFIKAIDKFYGKFSCINNLNAMLSEFNVDVDDPDFQDSMWVVSKDEVRRFLRMAKQILLDIRFRNYLEMRLDEDRMAGEWENKISPT